TPEESTENLNALNSLGYHPWELSFSYGRALQEPAQKAWAGKLENAGAAQAAMKKRARLNGLARSGEYSPAMENEGCFRPSVTTAHAPGGSVEGHGLAAQRDINRHGCQFPELCRAGALFQFSALGSRFVGVRCNDGRRRNQVVHHIGRFFRAGGKGIAN